METSSSFARCLISSFRSLEKYTEIWNIRSLILISQSKFVGFNIGFCEHDGGRCKGRLVDVVQGSNKDVSSPRQNRLEGIVMASMTSLSYLIIMAIFIFDWEESNVETYLNSFGGYVV